MTEKNGIFGLRRILRRLSDRTGAAPDAGLNWPVVASKIAAALDAPGGDDREILSERRVALLAGYHANSLEPSERLALERAISASPEAYADAVSALSFVDTVAGNRSAAPAQLLDGIVAEAMRGPDQAPVVPGWRRWLSMSGNFGGARAAAGLALVLLVALPSTRFLLDQQRQVDGPVDTPLPAAPAAVEKFWSTGTGGSVATPQFDVAPMDRRTSGSLNINTFGDTAPPPAAAMTPPPFNALGEASDRSPDSAASAEPPCPSEPRDAATAGSMAQPAQRPDCPPMPADAPVVERAAPPIAAQ